MPKPKINVKAVVAEIRSGVSDAELMEKYGLSPKGLESLFKKLIEANVLTAAEISQRSPAPSGAAAPSRQEPRPRPPESVPESGLDPQLAAAAMELLKQGAHDNELMAKLGLSPSQLKQLKEDLVRLGYLQPPAEEPEAPEPRGTKQCGSCGQDVPAEAIYCRHCGHNTTQPARQTPGAHPGRMAPEMPSEGASIEKYCEWEERGNLGTLSAYFQTAMKCLLTPGSFFSTLPLDSGYGSPLMFGVMSLVFAAMITLVWKMLFLGGLGGVGLFFVLIGMGCTFAGALVIVPIILFFWAGLFHLMLVMFGAAQSDFQATFRVVSYSSVTNLFSAIPFLGQIASFVWGTILNIMGLRETHETTTGKAAGAVLIPTVVVLLIAALVGYASVPWAKGLGSAKAKKARPAATSTYTGEALPSDVCQEIEVFIGKMDSVTMSTKLAEAQPEIKGALEALEKSLAGLKDDRGRDHARQLAQQMAMTKLSIIALQEKLGKLPGLDEVEKKQEEFRTALRAMCRK